MDKPIPEAALQAARVAYGSNMPDEERMRAALASAVPHLTDAQQQGQAVAFDHRFSEMLVGILSDVQDALGFTDEEARYKFGFLLDAFESGAPPHGGAAFGFDRWVALFGGRSDIREFIAFPKNNAARDVMIDAPSRIDAQQLQELAIVVKE